MTDFRARQQHAYILQIQLVEDTCLLGYVTVITYSLQRPFSEVPYITVTK